MFYFNSDNILTGFIKKELNNINTINIYDVESLENAIKILKEGEK